MQGVFPPRSSSIHPFWLGNEKCHLTGTPSVLDCVIGEFEAAEFLLEGVALSSGGLG